ncbi:reverse transcriptase, partial [Phytophthora megakarya]
EYHDVPTAGHPGREKTYFLLTRNFYWNHQYKWVHKYAPLQPLPTPSECWESVSMDFVFGLPRDSRRKTGIVVFVDRFSKMVHLAAVAAEVTSVQTARLFVDMVFKHHGMPTDFVSDRDPRFTARFWQEVFTLLGTQFSMPTADHPQKDGQTERVNRVLKTADTDLSDATTCARARARTRQGDVSVPVTDTVKNHEQATPASTKDNVSVRGTDTAKTHAQAGPVARPSDVSMPDIDTEKLHTQAKPVAITHEVSGTDADKTNKLDPGVSSQAMALFTNDKQSFDFYKMQLQLLRIGRS